MLLAVLLPGGEAQPALNGDLHTLREDAREGFGSRAEQHAVNEVGPVLPFAGLGVLYAVVDCDTEMQNRGPARRLPKLRVSREVARHSYTVDAHCATSSVVDSTSIASVVWPKT